MRKRLPGSVFSMRADAEERERSGPMMFSCVFAVHRAVVLLREVALKIRRRRRRRSLVAAFCGISTLRTMYWGL